MPGAVERVLEREHPAPRRAEQVDTVEPQRLAYRVHLGTEEVERPAGTLGALGTAAAELVVPDHRPLAGQRLRRAK